MGDVPLRRSRPDDHHRRILFVGAFPSAALEDVRGGQRSICEAVAGSSFWRRYDFVPFDSTQRSVPPPGLMTRAALAGRRFCRFVWALLSGHITDVVVLCSDGAGAVDKGTMIMVARLLGKKTAFYPVAFRLFADARRHAMWRWWVRGVVRFSNVIICQGGSTVDEVVQLGASPGSCHLVPNPMQLSEWYSGCADAEREGRIIFVGWISASKGIFDLLEALRGSDLLRAQSVVICGNGIDAADARKMADESGLVNVRFLGWVSLQKVQQLMKSSAIFVLPSYSEGMPQSIVEAFAAGAVVVTTPVGAIPDYVIDDETGSIVPVGRPDMLRDALEVLIRDVGKRERLRLAGQEVALKFFDVNKACDRLGEALERMKSG